MKIRIGIIIFMLLFTTVALCGCSDDGVKDDQGYRNGYGQGWRDGLGGNYRNHRPYGDDDFWESWLDGYSDGFDDASNGREHGASDKLKDDSPGFEFVGVVIAIGLCVGIIGWRRKNNKR